MPSVDFRTALSLTAAATAAAVSAAVAADLATAWEDEAVDFLYRIGGATLTDAMLALSKLGDAATIGALSGVVVVWLAWQRRFGDALFYTLSLLGAGLLVTLKLLFDRSRPEVDEILGQFTGSSYPSGHALLVAAVVTALAFVPEEPRRRSAIAVGGALVALADGAARVYLGAHFPLDVVGGWAMAVAWVAALAALGLPGRGRGRE